MITLLQLSPLTVFTGWGGRGGSVRTRFGGAANLLLVSCSDSSGDSYSIIFDHSATVVAAGHIHRMGQKRWVCIHSQFHCLFQFQFPMVKS